MFGVEGLRFRVWGSGFRVQDSGFRVQGSGFRVWGVCHPVRGCQRCRLRTLRVNSKIQFCANRVNEESSCNFVSFAHGADWRGVERHSIGKRDTSGNEAQAHHLGVSFPNLRACQKSIHAGLEPGSRASWPKVADSRYNCLKHSWERVGRGTVLPSPTLPPASLSLSFSPPPPLSLSLLLERARSLSCSRSIYLSLSLSLVRSLSDRVKHFVWLVRPREDGAARRRGQPRPHQVMSLG